MAVHPAPARVIGRSVGKEGSIVNAGRRGKRSRLLAVASAISVLLSSAYLIAAPVLAEDEVAEQTEGEDAALNIRKVDEEGNRLAGAVFTVDGLPGTYTTGADGHFCVTGLPNDSLWTVTEIEAPAGYEVAEPASQLVEVDDDGDCNSPDGVFVNTLTPPAPTPGGSEGESPGQPTPRDSVLGGNPTPSGAAGGSGGPLPNTAAAGTTAPLLAAVLAAVALGSLGALGYLRFAEARRRR